MRYDRFIFENTICNFLKVWKTIFVVSDGLFCFISICKSGSSEKSFAKITSLSELFFRFRRFILLVQSTKVISMNYGSITSFWKPIRLVKLDLILTMKNIGINSNLKPLKKFTTSSSRYTEFKDILPWNISQKIMKTIPISTRIVISYAMKQGILFRMWQKANGNWEGKWSKVPNGKEAIVEQRLRSEEK